MICFVVMQGGYVLLFGIEWYGCYLWQSCCQLFWVEVGFGGYDEYCVFGGIVDDLLVCVVVNQCGVVVVGIGQQ